MKSRNREEMKKNHEMGRIEIEMMRRIRKFKKKKNLRGYLARKKMKDITVRVRRRKPKKIIKDR